MKASTHPLDACWPAADSFVKPGQAATRDLRSEVVLGHFEEQNELLEDDARSSGCCRVTQGEADMPVDRPRRGTGPGSPEPLEPCSRVERRVGGQGDWHAAAGSVCASAAPGARRSAAPSPSATVGRSMCRSRRRARRARRTALRGAGTLPDRARQPRAQRGGGARLPRGPTAAAASSARPTAAGSVLRSASWVASATCIRSARSCSRPGSSTSSASQQGAPQRGGRRQATQPSPTRAAPMGWGGGSLKVIDRLLPAPWLRRIQRARCAALSSRSPGSRACRAPVARTVVAWVTAWMRATWSAAPTEPFHPSRLQRTSPNSAITPALTAAATSD